MAKKSVKGYSNLMKGLTAQQLWDMDKQQLERFLNYESKVISKQIERLIDSGYGEYSPLLIKRFQEGYDRALPKPITLKEAKNMSIRELRNMITELSYIAKAKTGTIRGVKKYLKEFKANTGVDPTGLSSSDWEAIRRKLEESPEYDSNDVIASYAVQDNNQTDEDYNKAWDKRIKNAETERWEREQGQGATFVVRGK